MGIALLGYSEGGADLDAAGPLAEQFLDLGEGVDAAGGQQRDRVDLELLEHLGDLGQHTLEVEAGVANIFRLGCAKVATGVARVFQHDGIGQHALAQPALEHGAHSTLLGEDRDQLHFGIVLGQLGQLEGQSGAHDDGIGAALAGLFDQFRVAVHGAHHVDRDETLGAGDLARRLDLAIQGFHVGVVDNLAVLDPVGAFHQIRVVYPQIDAGNGADGALFGDNSGQFVGRDTHPHTSLDYG